MRWTTTTMVAAFVVVDVMVLGGAYVLSQGRVGQDDPAMAVAPSASASASVTPSGSAGASPSAAATGTNDWTGPLSLSASPSGALLRVTRGSCDERVAVRARAWVAPSFEAPLREVTVPGLQEGLGAKITDSTVSVVGAGPDCKIAGFTSTDDGRTWKKGAVPGDVWYLDTDTTAGVVHGPVEGGDVNVDCTPVAVTTRDAGRTAYVSCSSQNVIVLDRDADDQDVPVNLAASAPAAATDGPGRVPLALGSVASCSAALVEMAQNRPPELRSCLGAKDAALGLAVSGDRVFAQAGYDLLLSTDGGRKFTAYPTG